MVTAGTGLAPFRGAVADRTAALGAGTELAPALCYFGCDAPDADFLHAAESAGAVSLRPAFSTAGTFVQHRIAAEPTTSGNCSARAPACTSAATAPGWRRAYGRPSVPCTGTARLAPTTRRPSAGWTP